MLLSEALNTLMFIHLEESDLSSIASSILRREMYEVSKRLLSCLHLVGVVPRLHVNGTRTFVLR